MTTKILIRRGVNGFKYSLCNENGYWFGNTNQLGYARENWKHEIKLGYVELVRQLDQYPEDKDIFNWSQNATSSANKF